MFKKVAYFFGFLCAVQSAFAQHSVNSHLFKFSDSFETVIVEDAMNPDSKFFQDGRRGLMRISYDYVHEPLIAVDEAKKIQLYDIVNRLQTITLGGGYLIHPRVWLGLNVPFHQIQLGNPFAISDSSAKTLGDIELKSKIRITSEHSKISVAVMPHVFFPTGDSSYMVSDDSYGFGAKILLDRRWQYLNLFGNIGFTSANHAQFLNIDRRRRMELAGGTFAKFYQSQDGKRSFGMNLEANWDMTVSSLHQDQNPLDLRAGFRGEIQQMAWFLGTGFSGMKAVQSANLGAYAGMKYVWGEKKVVAPPTLAPPPEPAPIPEWRKKIEIQRMIHFRSDSAEIDPHSYKELDSAAESILPYVSLISKITIHGHTDSTGSDEHNLVLSQHRAESVKTYLVSKGISADKLEPVGHGEQELKCRPEKTSEDRAINRRVIFEVNEVLHGTQPVLEKE